MKKQIIILTAVLSIAILFSACSTVNNEPSDSTPSATLPASDPVEQPADTPATEPESSPDTEGTGSNAINVVELYNEFIADLSAATDKYSGESITATGVVIRTGADIHGTPSIELSDSEDGQIYVLYVVNSFDQLDEVSVGETVTMKGNFHVFSSAEWGVVIKQGEVIEKE